MANRDPPNLERNRNHFLVTYLSEGQLLEVLEKHKESIKHFAFSLHDMDKDKEPHYHLLMKCHNALTVDTVLGWFDGFVDERGKEINSFDQIVYKDFGYCFRYLWHGNKADKEKFQYSFSRVICDDPSYFRKYQIELSSYEDKTVLAIQDLLSGVTFTECVYKYGRDFVLHSKSIMYCVQRMKSEIFGSISQNDDFYKESEF